MQTFFKKTSAATIRLFFLVYVVLLLCVPLSVLHAQAPPPPPPPAPTPAPTTPAPTPTPAPTAPPTPTIPGTPTNPNTPPAPAVPGTPTTPAAPGATASQRFVPLTNLPGLAEPAAEQDRTLADYINILYRLSIGLGALIAVIKIIFAGIKYMSASGNFSSTAEAKSDIYNSLFGLLIMLSTVIILQLIYPDILNINALRNLGPIRTITPRALTGPGNNSGAGGLNAECRSAADCNATLGLQCLTLGTEQRCGFGSTNLPNGAPCTGNPNCQSGICNIPTGQTAGACQAPAQTGLAQGAACNPSPTQPNQCNAPLICSVVSRTCQPDTPTTPDPRAPTPLPPPAAPGTPNPTPTPTPTPTPPAPAPAPTPTPAPGGGGGTVAPPPPPPPGGP